MAKNKKKKKHRFFWFTVKLQILLMIIVLGAFGYYYVGGYANEVDELQKEAVAQVQASSPNMFVPSQSSVVYDNNGDVISERGGAKDAVYVAYEDIPAAYMTAIVSIEDKKYYSHHGVDIKAVFRAAKALVMNGEVKQGGSTITMQLAKLMFMDSSQKTWQYKVKQMFLAVALEKKYSKTQIMEFYLNNIYFANGYYGIGAACQGYFDCDLAKLDISQIAFLLAIPNSPTYYDPLVNGDHTITRRDLILKNLWQDGKLSDDNYVAAVDETILLKQPQEKNQLWNNYVDTYAYRCATMALMENKGFEFQYYFDSSQEEQEYDDLYDELYADCQKELYSGGYEIYTSINMELQKELQNTIDFDLIDFTDMGDDGVYKMQGAGVCIDNATGYVVAIVGGRSQDFSTYTLNRAYQSFRQPGSSIKPLLVYAPAFEKGYTPDTKVVDKKIEGGPSNAGDVYYGNVDIRKAVAKSMNSVAWNLYEELTPEVGLQYLKNMNFSQIQQNDYVLATALGGFTKGVSPLEMAAGYATLENDGLYREPTCVCKIVDSNQNVVYISTQQEVAIYSEGTSREMTDVLTSVMTDGTGTNMKLQDMPCAGKTGTTNSYKDGWFCGYTRYYTTSIWVGCDTPTSIEGLKGSTYPGYIWRDFMEKAHMGLAAMDFLPYAQLSDDFVESREEQKREKQERRQNNEEKAEAKQQAKEANASMNTVTKEDITADEDAAVDEDDVANANEDAAADEDDAANANEDAAADENDVMNADGTVNENINE